MTRKDELIQRADLLSRRVGGGHGGKSIILEALQQLEREVLGRVANRCIRTIGTRIQYQDALSPGMQELAKVRNEELQALVDWLKSQQQELG